MKILVFTQKVVREDPVLGFFHTWITQLSKKYDSIEVICLEKGDFDLPKNVTVYSLGKESGASRLKYIFNLYKYLFLIRGSYDRVFVHMNQEYVILAGLYWKIIGIPVYMWRNHRKGDFLTKIAVYFCVKTFCTSTSSFVARFEKNVIMPVGNDTNFFQPIPGVVRKKHSICMLGRIAPVKHIELALESVNYLVKSGEQVSLTIIGSALPRDEKYFESLKKYIIDNNLTSYISMLGEVPFSKHPEVFSGYEISLNLTESGSFDKTILGSTSCGAIPLVSNASLKGILPSICLTKDSPEEIANSLKNLLNPAEQVKIQDDLKKFVESQSLHTLIERIIFEIK